MKRQCSADVASALGEALSSRAGFVCILMLALSVHLAVSSGSYSGYQSPPMFGDFEAQRHWMELTLHLPVREWYVNGTDNDLNYWGLDYPPLTAFHSLLLGKISAWVDSGWVALHSSRGIETDEHKLFMRLSVLVSLWALYIPAVLSCVHLTRTPHKMYYSAVSLLYPALIAMDNGHFQLVIVHLNTFHYVLDWSYVTSGTYLYRGRLRYNHISLGLFLWAVIGLLKGWRSLGSALFVLAVSFKQMELYHSLPIAVFLLATSLRSPSGAVNLLKSVTELSRLTIVVALALAAVCSPLLFSGAHLSQVLYRIFPFYRGIFEDKVANLWCALNVVVKLNNYSIAPLLKLSTALVLCAHIPSMCMLLWRPTVSLFKKTLFISSLSFFLFSFQVHEKSILLAAIPALLVWPEHPVAASWFLVISNASVFPLCVKDGNALHLSLFVFYVFLLYPALSKLPLHKWLLVQGSCVTSVILCVASLVVQPPLRYPHIFPLANALFCFVHFSLFLVYFNYITLREGYNHIRLSAEKLE